MPTFEPDPNRVGRRLLHSHCNSFRRRIYSAAPHDLAGIVDDANRRFLQRYIEADILTALGHGLAPLALRGTSTIPVPRLRHVPTCAQSVPSRAAAVKEGPPSAHRFSRALLPSPPPSLPGFAFPRR